MLREKGYLTSKRIQSKTRSLTMISSKLELAWKYRNNINLHEDSNLVACIDQILEILDDLSPIHKVKMPYVGDSTKGKE